MCGATGLWASALAFGLWLNERPNAAFPAYAFGTFLGLQLNA